MRDKLFILLAAITLTFMACDDKTVYHHYEHVSTSGWDKNDTLSFSVTPIKKAGSYQEVVEMRIDNTYPFLSLTLQVEQTIYPLAQTHRHNVECSLINENGHPTGTGISFYRYEFPVGKIELNEGDSIQIHIVHNMKREIMPGISDIGIRLTAD